MHATVVRDHRVVALDPTVGEARHRRGSRSNLKLNSALISEKALFLRFAALIFADVEVALRREYLRSGRRTCRFQPSKFMGREAMLPPS